MVALIVLVTGLLAALAAAGWSIAHTDSDPVDPQAEQKWIVRALRRHPRLAAFVRHRLDRTTAGGLLLTVGLAVVFGAAVLVGLVFDMIDEEWGFARWDRAAAEFGAENATDTSTTILRAITDLGGTPGIIVVTVAVAAWGLWRWRTWSIPAFLVIVAGGQSLLNNGLKWIVDRERPEIVQLAGHAGSSFPSGHSAAAAASWLAVALVLGRGRSRKTQVVLAAAAVLVAVAVAATRVLLGVHWLTDVIAGVFVGWGWFIIVAAAFGGRVLRIGEPLEEAGAVVPEPDRVGVGA